MSRISMDTAKVKKGCKAISSELDEIAKGVKYKQEHAYDFIAKSMKSPKMKDLADKIKENNSRPLLKTIKETKDLFEKQVYNEADQIEQMM